jgi:MFS family permease
VEESIVAQLTPPEMRSDVYAWYSLVGMAGIAFGVMTCGWSIHTLQELHGWSAIPAYRIIFQAYAVFGLLKFFFTMLLSSAVEAERRHEVSEEVDPSTRPLLDPTTPQEMEDAAPHETASSYSWSSLLPQISPESRIILVNLCILFALDAFASGLAPLSWTTYFFHQKFDLEPGKLGSLFFTTSIIASASTLVASSISKRFGNVKTMVFTHLPSAVALALIPVPSNVSIAMLLLILRSCTQSMDVAPRSAFLAAVVLPAERTAVMGTINVVKTFSQSLGPLITGVLAGKGLFWVAFVMAGSLKVVYDLGMLAVFAGHRTREERIAEESERDEES